MDWVALQKALYDWVVYGSGLNANQVTWEQQRSAARPGQPAITMRISSIDVQGVDWLDVDDNPLVIADIAFTAVDATANTLTKVAHGLVSGDGPIRLTTTGTLPGGLALATDYWVIRITDDTIKLAASYVHTGGNNVGNTITPIDLTDVGTGVHTLSDTTDTLRAGEEIRQLSRGLRYITLVLSCHTETGVGMGMAQAVLARVLARRALSVQLATLTDAKLSYIDNNSVRAINGVQSAILFEPRAILEIRFASVSEEEVDFTIIERVEITNEDTENVWTVPE